MEKDISVLGATGSIGRQTLDVARSLRLCVRALTGNRNVDLMERLAREFSPELVAMAGEDAAKELRERLFGTGIRVETGEQGLLAAARLDAATVVSAIVGAAGIRPTVEAIRRGCRVALANKEVLVAAGSVVMPIAKQCGAEILPVDSEHSAIFQCIQGRPNQLPCRIVLTASGGPFRTWTKEQIQSATVEQALRHPNWSMGRKITIDSASMVNKALEVIEARHLFGLAPEKIQVVIHPQSIIHSGVEFADGATLVQMGQPDMRVPIAYAMSYPERLDNIAPRLDLTQVGPLTFEQPDFERFPALKLAYQVLETGGSAPVLLNGANEIAVERVLAHRLPFWRIAPLLEETLSRVPQTGITCVEDVYAADRAARKAAEEIAARWAI